MTQVKCVQCDRQARTRHNGEWLCAECYASDREEAIKNLPSEWKYDAEQAEYLGNSTDGDRSQTHEDESYLWLTASDLEPSDETIPF